MITRCDLCLLLFIYACLRIITYLVFAYVYTWVLVYLSLPQFARFYLFTRVYLCLLVFTYVYSGLITCLPMFTRETYVYHSLPHVYHSLSYVYHCLLVLVYICLPILTRLMFTYFHTCLPLLTRFKLWLLVFTYV